MSPSGREISIVKVSVSTEQDIVAARQRTRRVAELLRFENRDQIQVATVVSELARNIYQYAKSGVIELAVSEGEECQILLVRASDKGPGITNLREILSGSYHSQTGMGVGLMGTKKLADHFEIETAVGRGTMVVFGKQFNKRSKRMSALEIGKIGETLVREQAPTPMSEIRQQNKDLLLALDELRDSQVELNELNRELSETNRGVVALYAELDEKALSLQKANEIKTSFLSNMTHEFRTPLSSIISLTRILLNRIDGELTPEQEKQVVYIRRSAENLLELVSDLLDIAKVEAGKIAVKPQEFTVSEIFGAMRGMFRPLLVDRGEVELQLVPDDSLPSIYSDEGKVSQILRNLISNAIKYTERGEIVVSAARGPDESILFEVRDTGIGVETENLDHIFKDFTQVDSILQRKSPGTGLGLPLSKRLANLLGGDLWAESEIGKGSRFFVRIPLVFAGESEGSIVESRSTDPIGDGKGARP